MCSLGAIVRETYFVYFTTTSRVDFYMYKSVDSNSK